MKTKQTEQTTEAKSVAGHTPGPWKVLTSFGSTLKGHAVAYEDEQTMSIVARCWDNDTAEEHGSFEANARLIAAAPELLEAAKLMLNRMGESVRACGHTESLKSFYENSIFADQLRAAISKAEGRA